MPFVRLAQAVVDEWRRVELQLEVAEPGTDEAETLEDDARRLRDQYEDLVDQAIEAGEAVPAPFPGE